MNENGINKKELNVDRGLELILSHKRKPIKENKILSFNISFFDFGLSFGIKKRSQEEKSCKSCKKY